MITKLDAENKARDAAFQQQVVDGIATIYRHPNFQNLLPCEANNSAIVRVCNEWSGFDPQGGAAPYTTPIAKVVPNVAIFSQYADDNPDFLKSLATLAPSKQMSAYLLEIEGLLSGTSPADIRVELGKLRYKNL